MRIKITEEQLRKIVNSNITEQNQGETGNIVDPFIKLLFDKVREKMGDKIDTPNNGNSQDKSDFKLTGDTKTDGNDLFKKLKTHFQDTPNDSLIAALVANAKEESNFKCDAKGDRGISVKRGNKYKPINGYCSFGLWQFNICGGLGISLLDEYNGDLSVLSDCDKQITFMSNHIKKKYPNYKENHTIGWWIDWIVDNIERPANKERAKRKRREWAQKTYGTI